MKKLFFLSLLFIGIAVSAQLPEGNANVGDEYGAGVSQTKAGTAVSMADLNKILNERKEVQDITVKATVTDVCPKKGCWITLDNPDKTKVFVKMKDYAFFLPAAIKGKTILLDGKAQLKQTSVEELKHYAEDAKKPQSEIDKITKPVTEIRLLASGIRVAQ
ncbi:DUF4920 domain-containing protein [Elizabethkingia occulta]|jgi:hypothetical protein|uniref:DUF4920 domain-containing protein n=1 Tax=Elizabethkingia occulta TaxID=1867263 RepID=A0A1T3MNL4_9FLAO|nr:MULTISPECIES: DUF4920 domain-containing protein [Elizabethkingia]MDR2228645.1 DUF4920 domain-containing protein [Flavobacteriaceae bacterium]MCL1663231.1 DUF4920 domain-containing protein [Elizabethkingia ursingii]OPB85008.1 DUF4920 domain-containing protein [Elizabethkingia occulta]OPC06465.1 DUF4920 domain-containing protein [Elizabethkingia ursingii]OPC66154.1 DUF4920 domain-containing protein [Elizabethkingia occulta]